MTVDTEPAPFNVPTVDLAPYLADPSSEKAEAIVQEVRKACMTTGFFSLIGHGVPRELQDAVFEGSEAFFKLSDAEKDKLNKRHFGNSGRGYEVIGSQGLQAGTLPDLKEVGTKFVAASSFNSDIDHLEVGTSSSYICRMSSIMISKKI
jgi:isopenicillin N synthase-like dioxygenase